MSIYPLRFKNFSFKYFETLGNIFSYICIIYNNVYILILSCPFFPLFSFYICTVFPIYSFLSILHFRLFLLCVQVCKLLIPPGVHLISGIIIFISRHSICIFCMFFISFIYLWSCFPLLYAFISTIMLSFTFIILWSCFPLFYDRALPFLSWTYET